MAHIGPFAERGLDKAFGFAVGAGRIGTSEAVANAELGAVVAEQVRAIATTVVGEQAANADAVLGIKSHGVLEESDGGGGLLIGEQLGEGETGVIIDGDMESLPAGKLAATATAAIATNRNLLIAGHSFDVEMQHVSWEGMFITHHRRAGMQVAPAIQTGALQDATDGGWAETDRLGDAVAR